MSVSVTAGSGAETHGDGRKRVLILVDNPYCGGVASHAINLCLGMRGHPAFETRLACFPGWRDDTTLLDRARALGIEAHVFPMGWRFDAFVVRRLRAFVEEERIALVHVHGYRGTLVAAAARLRVPVVSTCHGRLVAPALRSRLWEWAALRALRRHRAVVACSEDVRRWLETSGIPALRVRTIYNAVPDPGVFGAVAELSGISPAPRDGVGNAVSSISPGKGGRRSNDTAPLVAPCELESLVVGLFGRLVSGKGCERLLEAVAGESGIVVVFVGDGPLRESLEVRARKLGVTAVFAGLQADPAPYYRRVDIVALPSEMEALPMTLVEAAAFGKPAVATRAGGIPEIVRDGETGFLVALGDAAALRTALLELKDPELRRVFGMRAREVWRERFTIEIFVGQVAAAYAAALSSSGGEVP